MVTTIDSAGRIVVPKRLREELHFRPGQELEMCAIDGRLEIKSQTTPIRLEERDGQLVAVTDREMPTLTAEMVRDTLEQIRR
jgi:AbrB family looped-hinge helix DNA binding protein